MPEGIACIHFRDLPQNWLISPKDQGGDDYRDSDADPITAMVKNLQVSEALANVDLSIYQPDHKVHLPLVLRQ